MKLEKFKTIKIALLESQTETDKKAQTVYLIRSSAVITMNEVVKKTIEEEGIENVLDAIFTELKSINKDNVDSVGIWYEYDGKNYESSIKLQTLDDMKKFGEEDVSPIYELFKLSSDPDAPAEGEERLSVV